MGERSLEDLEVRSRRELSGDLQLDDFQETERER